MFSNIYKGCHYNIFKLKKNVSIRKSKDRNICNYTKP